MADVSTREVLTHLRNVLPQYVFAPRPQRLGWFVLHLTVVLGGVLLGLGQGLGATHIPSWTLPFLSVAVGASMAGLAFVAHEVMHGAVVKNATARRWIAQLAWAPFCLSADLWAAWHNRAHHPHTNVAGRDPDAYPTEEEYLNYPWARWTVEVGAPGMRRFRGILMTLLGGFSIQSLQMLLTAQRRGLLTGARWRRALLHSALMWAGWAAWASVVGVHLALVLYVVPLLIANAVVMGYILTNHSLQRGVDADEPLATTLSVMVPRWYAAYSLQFGYHVEHHLFPGVSHVHGPLIQRELLRLVPHRYRHMSLIEAWRRIHRTPRVRRDQVWLVDPPTGHVARTLGDDTGSDDLPAALASRFVPVVMVSAVDRGVAASLPRPPSVPPPSSRRASELPQG